MRRGSILNKMKTKFPKTNKKGREKKRKDWTKNWFFLSSKAIIRAASDVLKEKNKLEGK